MPRTLSPEIIRFILTSIPSVVYLEALLLLRAEPATVWAVGDLARRLYVNEKIATAAVGQLVEDGIAATIGGPTFGCKYEPVSLDLGRLLDQLAQSYASDLLEVTRLIHSRSDRIAQQFADAFKWRKED